MQAKVVHYLTLAAALIGGVALAVRGAVGNLPEKWQPTVLLICGVAAVVVAALIAAKVALTDAALTHDSKLSALHVGMSPQAAINFAHNDTPVDVPATVVPDAPATQDVQAELPVGEV